MIKKIIVVFIFGFLIALMFNFISRTHSIRDINYAEIYSQIDGYLKIDKGKINISVRDNVTYIDYDYAIKENTDKPLHRKVPFDLSSSDFLIYVYGSSSLVSKPPFYKGDFPFIPSLLESELNKLGYKNFKVINFSIPSFDSFDIKELIKATVNYKKPDLVISFDPATMDFESAYYPFIKKRFYLVTDFLKKFSTFYILSHPPRLGIINKLAYWFLKACVEPNLINLAQEFRLISLVEEPFIGYNQLILSYYKNNMHEIIEFTQKRKIPLIILTAVTNLEARPYGIYGITDTYYKEGMRQKDYRKRIAYLTKAKDSEVFTGDLGSKSCAYDFLVNVKEKDVYILDLQKKLTDAYFEFNYKYFYDYGHMKPALHKIITGYILEFLKEYNLI